MKSSNLLRHYLLLTIGFTRTPDRPEDAIAFDREAFDRPIHGRFELKSFMHGSTAGGYDPFLRDIIILEKKFEARLPKFTER